MRAIQQLAAQGGSAFDGSMEPLDDHRSILGVGLEIEQAQAAVDYGKQVAEVVGVGLSRVTFDLWGRVVGKVDAHVSAKYARNPPICAEQRDLDPGEARGGQLRLPSDQGRKIDHVVIVRTLWLPERGQERVKRLRRQFPQSDD
jgi:hypothetical protein